MDPNAVWLIVLVVLGTTVWKPAYALTVVGVLVTLIGMLPFLGAQQITGDVQLGGLGGLPAIVAGVALIGLGRIVSLVKGMHARLTDDGGDHRNGSMPADRRRDPT